MMRSDARRNRELLLAAARQIFAEHGLDASMDEIARSSGVGNATLYRRFPTREALIEEVFGDMVAAFQGIADRALEIEDPWRAVAWFMEEVFTLLARDRGLNDLMSTRFPGAPALEAAKRDYYETAAVLIGRAQEAGVLRADFAATDIVALIWSLSRGIAATATVAPDFWRRQLAFFLDGLRAEAARPLPRPPLTYEELDQAMLHLRHTRRST
ncbi:TetR family transcriptional regulator [Microtetraspora sp. NBRC 13810]|uniref:TetR/AcrR family transcriptional regulator n=1 Tax=Microtetraspora sp. NBRC 13810 TaxID=3030990 RepID=UPI0024A05424|nr:TetR/AcrR family transcriptional regulator [Microtetraspora sp. NBRC 13810]GLW11247.1 TetR family transcriptional regulator [Microtetraspora sp. NBRC 13810]